MVTYEKFPHLFKSETGLDYIFDEIKELNVELYDDFLRINANSFLPKRTMELAKILNLSFDTLKIKGLVNRWGSCSSKKIITLNYRLMQFEPILIEYVIVHELCHLLEMNHSSKFWKLVAQIFPNYLELRKRLSEYR